MKWIFRFNFNVLIPLTGLILATFISPACDPAINYKYIINNQSDKELRIYYKRYHKDSILNVLPKTQMVILEAGLLGSNPHDENENFLLLFDSLSFSPLDSTKLILDYHKRENWTYSMVPSHFGLIKTGLNIYKIEISNKYFSNKIKN